ncbi:MAG: DUF3040 domain-containing protein [Micromonosporaceae bacterium]
MLSQDDRHRLDEIERHLRADDPRFVARMEQGPDPRRRRIVLLCLLLWALAPIVGVLGGWTAALAVAPLLLVGTALLRLPRRR